MNGLRTIPESLGRVGVFTFGLRRIRDLPALLGADEIVLRPDLSGRRVDTVVGWGRKANTLAAYRYARRHGCRYLLLEDGFLRSVRPGSSGDPPLSIVVDDLGIYYDATRPSRLERMLCYEGPDDVLDDPALLGRARACMEQMRAHALSKYNHAPRIELEGSERPRVLVVDQAWGDLSVRLGQVDPNGLEPMLEAALRDNPEAEIVVKIHPDVAAGKRGYLTGVAAQDRVRVLREPANAPDLLRQVDRVYVATSLVGLEALVAGRDVTCFGAPFYAGWGLTDDRVEVPRRGRRRSLEQLFAAAYLLYMRCVDPDTGTRCDLERLIDHLALQRELGDANEGKLFCVGMSAWKRGFVPNFLSSPRNEIRFVRSLGDLSHLQLGPDARMVVWGVRDRARVEEIARRHDVPVWHMEDGFLRSVGLGSDLFTPASLVVDREGIYYDPGRPSELETLLSETRFGAEELARAARLRELIVERGISKYNVGTKRSVGPPPGDGRPTVLAIGQVEDDASIELGCPGTRTNAGLLREVRERRPDAFIVFKPHPDVVSGNREGAVAPEVALRWCDQVVEDAVLADCLAAADEVHTLTSLVGFEALLRGIPVVVHGQPFYAGWGLTEDVHPHPRRRRTLTLDELVAGALIRYPRYVSHRTGAFTSPEHIVEQLDRQRSQTGPLDFARTYWVARQARKLANLARGVLRAP